MAAIDNAKIVEILTAHAAEVMGQAPQAIPPVLIDTLLGFLGNLAGTCFGKLIPTPTPTPTLAKSSAEIATQIKSASAFDQGVYHAQIKRYFADNGRTRREATVAAQTLAKAVQATPADDLARLIDDARGRTEEIAPEFSMG